jgi:hypothetical protein
MSFPATASHSRYDPTNLLPLPAFRIRPTIKAAAPQTMGIAPEYAEANEALKAQALRNIAKLSLAGLGGGASIAALMGLKNLLFKPEIPEHELDLSPQEVELSYPERKKEGSALHRFIMKKQADWADSVVKEHMPTTGGEPNPPVGSLRWLRGDTNNAIGGMPWVYPGLTLAGIGGLYGGYKLVDWLAKKRRKSESEGDLEEAKEEYEQAMKGMYGKQAAATLDDVCDTIESKSAQLTKQAGLPDMSWWPGMNNVLGGGTGAYLALAALLTGGAGLGAYHLTRSKSPSKTLEEALRQRAQVRSLQNPPEIYINPDVGKRRTDEDDEEEASVLNA